MAYLLHSPIHGETFVKEVARRLLQSVGFFKNPETPAPEKFPLIIHATGGTTAAALDLVKKSGARGAVLLGFGEHNSFASVLHAKAEIEALGLPVVAYHCPSYNQCGDVAARAKKVADTASSLVGAKAVLIGSETYQAQAAREKLGWAVEVVPLEKFEEAVDASEPDDELLKLFGDDRVAKVATALEKVSAGANLVAIQCFPFLMKRRYTPCLALALLNSRGRVVACEGDLAAGLAMLMSRGLTGYSGWIANVVSHGGAEAVFAHCTIALNMAKSWRIMPHFESGYPHGLAAELKEAVYTAVSISPRFNKAALGRVEVVRSGNFLQEACRTQAQVRFRRAVKLEEEAPANHHVFTPGDVVDEAEAVLRLLAIPTSRY